MPLDTIDYQYGVGGLGHALLYLTDNKLVDADFHTFFGAQQNQIISAIQESDDTSFLLDSVPYLIEYQKVFGEKRVQTAINQVVNDSFGFILNIFDNWDSETQKEDRITCFRFLLKTVYLQKVRLPDIDLDVNVLNKTLSVWEQLYEDHKIRHSHAVSFYINQLSGWSTSDVNQLFRPIDLVTTSVLDLPSVIQLNTMQLLSNKFDWQNNPMNRLSDINVLELLINKIGSKQPENGRVAIDISHFLFYYLFTQKQNSHLSQNDPDRFIPLLI